MLCNVDYHAERIANSLKDGTYKLSPNRCKTIKDGASQKERDITIPAFYPDQIIQWALVQVLTPIFMRGMYEHNCGSIPHRGGIAAKRYVEKVLRKPNSNYVLKLDIRKYFPSVSHDKLKELLAKRIKDKQVLKLLSDIIDNGGDGLPIGYYTSQWLSNFYLQEVDHYIKEVLHVKYYVRYVDDMVLLDNDKAKLHRARLELSNYLQREGYGLTLKENWQLWQVDTRPIDFVGYKLYSSRTLLRRANFNRIKRLIERIKVKGLSIKRTRRYMSYYGWCKNSNFKGYYLLRVKPVISTSNICRYILVRG